MGLYEGPARPVLQHEPSQLVCLLTIPPHPIRVSNASANGPVQSGGSQRRRSARAERYSIDLDQAFTVGRMRRVWKNTVRTGLRGQAVEDLHDYLDVHRNLDPFLERLRALVTSGRYRPSPAEVVTLEKGDGISRRLLLPWPGDAILLQTLVEVIEPVIRAQQPTANAFYSRSHTGPNVDRVDGSFAYPWWLLWPEFQQRIWRFAEESPYTVVTDVANYFDSIPLAGLRNALASMGTLEEPLLDFLFFMLEAFTWRPHYMPLSGVGLPQIDFDAPRLLAHAYLFVADAKLARLTGQRAVRWADDIDFGTDSVADARRILGKLDTLLSSYGLRLNTGKTEILDMEHAARHFWIQENRELTILKNAIEAQLNAREPNPDILDRSRELLIERWGVFRDSERVGHYDKMLGRYFTVFGKLRDPVMESVAPSVLLEVPKLRDAVLRYYLALGFSLERLGVLEGFLRDGHCVDDASVFHVARCIVNWRVPADADVLARILALANELPRICEDTDIAFVAALWLLAKYGHAADLGAFLETHRRTWERSDWLARQVAAATPRLTPSTRQSVISALSSNGLRDGLSVAAHLGQLKKLAALDEQLDAYLRRAPHPVYGYPLAKILLAMALLEGDMADEQKRELQDGLLELLDDPIYRSLVVSNPARPLPPALVPRRGVASSASRWSAPILNDSN
jgi:hypothetical protein